MKGVIKIIKNNVRKGFVLVSALMIASISLLLLIPYASGVLTDFRLTSMVSNSTQALDIAEAGADRAIWEIRYNNKISSFTIPVTSFQSSDGASRGEYEVATILPDNSSAVITSYGYVPSKQSCRSKRIVMVTYSLHRAFGRGVIGVTGITMSGQADIDSYDSSKGIYGASLPDGTINRGQEGDIASNGPITLSGLSKVYGNANPGPGYPFSGVPNVTGSYGTLAVPITVVDIPSEVITAAQIGNDNSNIYKNVLINGVMTKVPYALTDYIFSTTEEVNLPGGTYYFSSITTTGAGKINVLGPSNIYVVGNINIAGQGIVNVQSIPRNLLLYSTGSDIKVAGQGVFYGAIYAPNATVTYTGQADYYGSIVCGFNADKGQAALHYDKDLANVMPNFVVNKVTSWQEIQQ